MTDERLLFSFFMGMAILNGAAAVSSMENGSPLWSLFFMVCVFAFSFAAGAAIAKGGDDA